MGAVDITVTRLVYLLEILWTQETIDDRHTGNLPVNGLNTRRFEHQMSLRPEPTPKVRFNETPYVLSRVEYVSDGIKDIGRDGRHFPRNLRLGPVAKQGPLDGRELSCQNTSCEFTGHVNLRIPRQDSITLVDGLRLANSHVHPLRTKDLVLVEHVQLRLDG